MAAKNKKIAAAVTAVTLAVTLAVGGTMAWQSISQEATNIVTNEVNPGGRLHDDFDGSNDKNVYVENFGTQNIYARVQLSEYLAVGVNAHNLMAEEEPLVGSYDADSGTFTYETYRYGQENESDKYWTKDWGGSTKFIPTFNKDQDSLEADLNGTYEYLDDEGAADPYGDFVDYNTAEEGYSVTAYEWFDADTNDAHENHEADENGLPINTENHSISENKEIHTLADSLTAEVISMGEWLGEPGNFWVYDTDGWAYWAKPIAPGEATGLLLDSITNLGLIDEDYYYAIHVKGQFITAGDLGKDDGTGFYDAAAGTEPTAEALALLDTIGVKTGEGEGGDDPGDVSTLSFYINSDSDYYIPNAYKTIKLTAMAYDYAAGVTPDTTTATNWAVSGNIAADTTITDNGDGTATLYVSADEKEVLTVSVEYEYEGEIETATCSIMNTPTVGTIMVYDDSDEHLGTTYAPGTEKTVNLQMYIFEKRTVDIQDKSDAYTGTELDMLADNIKFSIVKNVDGVYNPADVTGVTVVQDQDNPTKATLTISADAAEEFAVMYGVEDYMYGYYDVSNVTTTLGTNEVRVNDTITLTVDTNGESFDIYTSDTTVATWEIEYDENGIASVTDNTLTIDAGGLSGTFELVGKTEDDTESLRVYVTVKVE